MCSVCLQGASRDSFSSDELDTGEFPPFENDWEEVGPAAVEVRQVLLISLSPQCQPRMGRHALTGRQKCGEGTQHTRMQLALQAEPVSHMPAS